MKTLDNICFNTSCSSNDRQIRTEFRGAEEKTFGINRLNNLWKRCYKGPKCLCSSHVCRENRVREDAKIRAVKDNLHISEAVIFLHISPRNVARFRVRTGRSDRHDSTKDMHAFVVTWTVTWTEPLRVRPDTKDSIRWTKVWLNNKTIHKTSHIIGANPKNAKQKWFPIRK